MQAVYDDLAFDAGHNIRLLQIEGIAEDGLISISLAVFATSSRPHYHALSYTWSNPLGLKQPDESEHKTISCNGRPFDVLANLHGALTTLSSSEYQNQLFWFDAVCINQHDAVEKSAQLLLMPMIYRCADSVIIYLGSSDEDTQPALALIETIGKMRQQDRSSIRPSNLNDPSIASLLGDDGARLSSWRSLARLFCRSYFRRAWIIQEVLNASSITVFCGHSELNWFHLVKMSDLLSTSEWTILFKDQSFAGERYNTPQHDGPAKLRATKYQRNYGEDMLLYSLIRTRPYLCSDPRDKIFSLLPTSQVINYDFSIAEVYTRAAKILLEQGDDLLMLSHVEGQDYSTLGDTAPSWVPDWSVTRSLGLGITGYKRYSAAGNRAKYHKLNGSTLELKGELIATVKSVGEAKQQIRAGESVLSWLQLLDSVHEQCPYTQSLYEVLWRVLVADTAPKCPAHLTVEQYFSSWLVRHLKEQMLASADIQKEINTLLLKLQSSQAASNGVEAHGHEMPDFQSINEHDADRYESFFGHSMCNRLFVTDSGHIGMGTTSLQAGDHVYLIHGSRIPLIFRPQNHSTDEYKLVGGCYLHGTMHGEMLGQAATVDLKIL